MDIDIFQKRCDLILDYISQILVYGSSTKGIIGIDKNKFEDGNYLVLTVSVIKNSYFRWHDLGVLTKDSIKLYKLLINSIIDKFGKFDITFVDNVITVSNRVNGNEIDISFTFTNKKDKEYFLKQRDLYYTN